MVTRAEIDDRYRRVRDAMAEHELEAMLVCGSEYTGFEGAITYMSGFVIVHRYAYVLLPREGDPTIVFPAEARYVGEHGTTWIDDQVFAERPGEWLRDRLAGLRVGVYGLDYAMTVRDFAAMRDAVELLPWEVEFDHARAVKSDEELASVRDSVRINTEGFHAFREAYAPGRSAAEVLAPAERLFVEEGCGRLTMNMVLVGPEFAIARRDIVLGDFCIPSLEIAGPGGHWVEVSRALGSRRNQERRRERLLAEGLDEEALERISGPSGLDLGASTPAETAVSILAEILAVRAGRDGGRLKTASGRIHAEV